MLPQTNTGCKTHLLRHILGFFIFIFLQWTAGKDQGSQSFTTVGPGPPKSSLRMWSKPLTITLLLHQSKKKNSHNKLPANIEMLEYWHRIYVESMLLVARLYQVSSDPVHRGALPYRAAASDGSDFPGSVWRQAADRTRGADS